MILAFVTAFVVAALPGVAAAGVAVSSWGYFTTNGVQYRNKAEVVTSTGQAHATAWVGPRYQSVGSGWVGARGRLFTSGGALSCEGTTTYNGSSLSSGSSHIAWSCIRSQGGTWYGYGVTYGWNGSSYNPVYTFKSPNQNS